MPHPIHTPKSTRSQIRIFHSYIVFFCCFCLCDVWTVNAYVQIFCVRFFLRSVILICVWKVLGSLSLKTVSFVHTEIFHRLSYAATMTNKIIFIKYFSFAFIPTVEIWCLFLNFLDHFQSVFAVVIKKRVWKWQL